MSGAFLCNMDNNEILKKNGGRRYDVCLMNPPFSGSLHLEFLDKVTDLCEKSVVIEPSTWLINLQTGIKEKQSSQMKKYQHLKTKIKNHIKSVDIENLNELLNIGNDVAPGITCIDYSKDYDNIEYNCFGKNETIDSIESCNLIGNYDIIKSIFEKLKSADTVINHIYDKNVENKNYSFCKFSTITTAPLRWHNTSYKIAYTWDSFYIKHKRGEYYNQFIKQTLNDVQGKKIFDEVPKKRLAGGGKSKVVRYSDKDDNCVYGTRGEMENYVYYNMNNSLPLFINICMTIDQNNNSIQYVPWLVDKKYTDEEIYKLFNFNKEEIELIEDTLKRFERHSPWFKRYMTGDTNIKVE